LPSSFKTYLLRLTFLLTFMLGLRVFFVWYNLNQLPDGDFSGWIYSFLGGFLFDWVFCWYAFLPLLFLTWFEDKVPVFSMIGKVYTLVVSLFLVLLSTIDTLFFPFSKVRTGAELLNMGGENNISPFVYIFDYWWAVIWILLVVFILWKYYPKSANSMSNRWKHAFFLLMIPIGFFIARGGTRLKPLHYTDAILFAPNGPWPVSLNSGLVFAQSFLGDDGRIFAESIPNALPLQEDVQQFSKTAQPYNVCLIVLESFGKEYTGKNGLERPSYTPFLDSLTEKSLYFDHFYANGLKSMDAVPAIFASIPALFNKPLITSSAAGERFTGMAACLKKMGYQSAFFHGADEGSMGFKPFLLRCGFDRYYSKNDFKGKTEDSDGQWGIFDEPFFQYSIREMDQMKQPFLTGIFTLSSHHPYTIPNQYAGEFQEGTLPIHKSIQYADDALKKFFIEAAKHPWFENTIFILTADHTAMNETARYQNPAGRYEIPLLIYSEKLQFKGHSEKTGQHIDLLPTVLDLIGYSEPFISMGRSLLDSTSSGKAFQYFQGNYGYIEKNRFIMTQGNAISGYFDLKNDPDAVHNLYAENMEEASMLLNNMHQTVGSFQQRLKKKQLVY